MEIFIDTANIEEIDKWLKMGVIDGVTTNPSIMYKDGIQNIKSGAQLIANLIDPLPLSVEVTTNNLNEMIQQAHVFSSWANNIVIKIPQINPDGTPCYGVIKQLAMEGIRVNATAAMSLGQVILSAKANATYISIFLGRVTDEGGDANDIISKAVKWTEKWEYKGKILIGSIRSVGDIITAAIAGAHIITIPPQFISKMADHKYSRETVKQFVEDSTKSMMLLRNIQE